MTPAPPRDEVAPTGRRSTVQRLLASPLGAFPLVSLAFSLLVGAGTLWARPQLERIIEQQVSNRLLVVRDASIAAVTLWLGGAQRALRLALTDAEVRDGMRRCFVAADTCDLSALADRFRPYTAAIDVRDLIVADRQGRRRGDAVHGLDRQLPHELVIEAERLADDEVRILPAVIEAGQPALFVGAPVVLDGTRVGVLLLELPLDGLDAVLQVARAGQSGETYAFDGQGRFVSQSRFVSQLHGAGLLANTNGRAALSVALRDPGVDLTVGSRASLPRDQQPLTRMARDAVVGGDGVDVTGYRDYRGVPVVGAWRWLPAFGIGVATEEDHEEAFAALSMLYRLFGALLAILTLSCVSLIVGSVFVSRLRARALRAQDIAERFGQYRIVRKLGEGGMGSVYLADHEMLRRPAVIKLVRSDRMSGDAVARFEREVRLTSTLAHPNTVAIYDYGLTDAGTPYYAMEYLQGVDLERLVTRFGPLPEERVVHLLRQLCGSLTEAHARELVHRDIKPANLFLCRRVGAADTLKVLDFGIAKSLGQQRVGLTESRLLLGTPEYMAPELFESGANASAQSDLYAIGCVAYFLLTGTPVFEGSARDDDIGLAHLVERPTPPSARLGTPIDADLEAAVLACLAKRRDARPRGAAALRALLDRSAIAHRWTEARAEAFWTEHSAAIEALEAEQADRERPPTLHRLRPRRRVF